MARGLHLARCDEGYGCEVCGRDVEAVTDSDLYLRYVLGEVPLRERDRAPEVPAVRGEEEVDAMDFLPSPSGFFT